MSLDKPLESLDESDLHMLIENKVQEGRFIDYKKDLTIKTDGDKKEFLYDISSFANTTTGHLIIGMEEQNGIPISIPGVALGNTDATKIRLNQIIQDGIEPRMVPNPLVHIVPLKRSDCGVIVIRVYKSLTTPHLVSYDKSNKFYARNSAGKYLLDVGEIRNLFLLSESRIERIRNFRAERIAKIIAQDTPIILKDHAKCILHLVPLSISDPNYNYEFSSAKQDYLQTLVPLTSSLVKRYNLDGLLAYGKIDNEPGVYNYTQLFRNGSIEAVDTYLLRREDKKIPNKKFEQELIGALKHYLLIQEKMGVQPPIFVMLSLSDVKGYDMLVKNEEGFISKSYGIDREILVLPEVAVERFEVNHAGILKPIFDMIWNACGWEKSLNYDEKGNWSI
jgi:Putative DNA-binding domain